MATLHCRAPLEEQKSVQSTPDGDGVTRRRSSQRCDELFGRSSRGPCQIRTGLDATTSGSQSTNRTSDQARLPAEFKHINKRRKRN